MAGSQQTKLQPLSLAIDPPSPVIQGSIPISWERPVGNNNLETLFAVTPLHEFILFLHYDDGQRNMAEESLSLEALKRHRLLQAQPRREERRQ